MGINSTRGQTLGYDQETSLGVSGGSYGEIRWNDNDLAWPTTSRVGIANPNIGHAHSADRGDLPIFVEDRYGKAD